mmetsp:Transcript_15389/g.30889  ORF Transcript_15389/g.30889 Transcript_15389/m.30889 type:complete len:235 (-) Transcript_15389:367-1071(-)
MWQYAHAACVHMGCVYLCMSGTCAYTFTCSHNLHHAHIQCIHIYMCTQPHLLRADRERSMPIACSAFSNSPKLMAPDLSTSIFLNVLRQARVSSSSITSSGERPRMQPIDIPIMEASESAHWADALVRCNGVNSGSGSPIASVHRSMTLDAWMPHTSDTKFPRPAAAIEERHNVVPRRESIWSPAMIIIALSRKPKPTKGIAVRRNSWRSCVELGPSILPCESTAVAWPIDKDG